MFTLLSILNFFHSIIYLGGLSRSTDKGLLYSILHSILFPHIDVPLFVLLSMDIYIVSKLLAFPNQLQ